MKARLLAITVLLVTGLGAGLTACGDEGDPAAGGDVVPGHVSDEVQGDSAYVLLPSGRLDVTVGEPTTDAVTAEQAADGDKHAAPEGGSWVPVMWEHDPFGEGAVPIGIIGADPQPADVSLRVGDQEVDLGEPYAVSGDGTKSNGTGTMYVAVDGEPDSLGDITIAVGYDGLTQTVVPATGDRDAGAAAPLYGEPLVGIGPPCTSDGFDAGRVRAMVSCVVSTPQPTPYLPGHGWSQDGRTFLLVPTNVQVDAVSFGPTSYDVTSLVPTVTLDGRPPLTDETYGAAAPEASGFADTFAFDTGAGDGHQLGIELALTLDKADAAAPGPGAREVALRQVVELSR